MIDWRTILKAPPYTQNTQNEQNAEGRGNFADIADIADSNSVQETTSAFSAVHQQNQPDIPDILPSVSGLSGPTSTNAGGNLPPALPAPPLQPGWLVVYRDRTSTLCGGADDRDHGTVEACRWEGFRWTVLLTDGQALPLSTIRAVGQTDAEGRLLAAWTVRECGYDGKAFQGAHALDHNGPAKGAA